MRISVLVFAACAACGGGSAEGTGPGGPGGAGSNTATTPGDVAFDVPPLQIEGIVFEPEAMGRPPMALYAPKGKYLDKENKPVPGAVENFRREFTKEKDPFKKQLAAAIFATMLYLDDKAARNETQKKLDALDPSKRDEIKKLKEQQDILDKKLWTEARQALRDAQSGAKQIDEATYRLLGSFELMLDDYAAGEKAWQGLVEQSPKDKEIVMRKAWWAYALLRQFKNAEALAVVKNEKLDPKDTELAYVTAWALWRTGDQAGAWKAISIAAPNTSGNLDRSALDRDVLLFASRANVPFDQVLPQLTTIFGTQQAQQYGMLAKLGLQAYGFAGRWSEGIAAIDKAIDVAGNTVPANDKPVLRFQQADFEVRLDAPANAATYAKQALDALPACGAKCSDKEKQDLVIGIFNMATLFHILYATANDVRYYQPAHDLYQATQSLIMDGAKRAEAQSNFNKLEMTLKNTKAGTGTHDRGAIGALLGRHNQEVQACYEAQLIANPKLAGTVTTTLDVEQGGGVKGVATEPKAGAAELSAVAGCVIEHAKTWKLPKRGMAGSTRIKLTYNLAPKKN